jgi:competence protein ComEC
MGAALVVLAGLVLGARRWAVRAPLHAPAALVLLGGAGLTFGADLRASDARCVADMRAATSWTVVLADDAAPGSFVRAVGAGRCAVPYALAVRRGEAPAGAHVRVTRGEASDGPRGLLVREAAITVERGPGPLARWRSRVGRTLDRRFGADAPIVRALLIADTRGLSPEVRERYADAGLVHILSISGLHVAIVGGALLLLFEALRLGTTAARASAVAVIVLYVVAIGAPPPAVRSATLFAAVALTRAWQRPVSPWGTFSLGALVPLVEPRTVLDLGWQLSVAGYAAVIVSARAARRVVPADWDGWRNTLARDLIAGVLTTAATAPLVAWHFGRLSLVSPLSNLFASPVVALLQPTLFLAMVLPSDVVATVAADAARPMIATLDFTATTAASAPGAAVIVAPTLWSATLSALAVAALLVAGWRREWRGPLTVAFGAVAFIAWAPSGVRAPVSGGVELHLIDVGQGDALAVRTPRGRWVLVDAGRVWSSGDAGRSTVIPHVRRRGGELAMLVLTHPHADHIGGAASVLRALKPPLVREAAFVEPSPVYADVLRTAAKVGVTWQRAQPGTTVDVDGVAFEFLAPDSAWTESLSDPNAASVIVRVRFGVFSALLTGDAEAEEESWLLARGADVSSLVLKVGHHGSATSTSPAFLDAVAPRLALVSVGAGNHYGHPSPDVMRRLAESGATILRTDQLGTVVLRSDGLDVSVEAAGHRWMLSRPLPDER